MAEFLTEKQKEINTNELLDRLKNYADKSDEEIYMIMAREDCEYLTNGIPMLLSRMKTYSRECLIQKILPVWLR